MFATNFLTNPSSKAAAAAYEAARATSCNPDSKGRCRQGGSTTWSIFPTSTTVSTSASAATFGSLFIIAVVIFIIFLILVFVHYTMFPIFALSVNDPGLVLIPISSDRELSYKKDGIAVSTKRRGTDTGITGNTTTLPACSNYTIGIDIFINGGLTPITYPNVILHRDTHTPQTTPAGRESATKTNFHTKYTNTNILIWLDKETNNLNVTLVTVNIGLAEQLQHLPPIENVPLNKKFRLAVVLADSFIEVYINGGLERSMQITGNLKQIGSSTAPTDFYPPITTYEVGGVKVSNMSMWPRVITSKEIRTYEAAPMSS
jgi:hypothetical protein